MIKLTNRQARQFLLLKHGLLGEHKFIGKQGALDFIRQAGCIQFDPVDICGKNAELTLQSRVKKFKKKMLHDLLYKDRALFDYPDKQLSIIPTEDWPYFERFREAARTLLSSHPEVEEYFEKVLGYIEKHGAVNSDDLELEGDTSWRSAINWSTGSKLSRAVLEQLYSSGDLIVHHKKGTRRYYDLAERHIPHEVLSAPDPLPDDFEFLKWRVLRRIGAIGLLWNRGSDAWLNIWEISTEKRNMAFESLIAENLIVELTVEGLSQKLYCLTQDMPLVNAILTSAASTPGKPYTKPRCELIAPLDPLMWDRKLVAALYGFHYSWEIYTPPDKRKYGAYVLPLLCGEQMIGRVEVVSERKSQTLTVKNVWYEAGTKRNGKTEKMIEACFKRFADFNDCKNIILR